MLTNIYFVGAIFSFFIIANDKSYKLDRKFILTCKLARENRIIEEYFCL